MREFFHEAVLKPALAILFCLVFGGFFVFFGFQAVYVCMTRTASGQVTGTLTRQHFWGLYSAEYILNDVTGAAIETTRSHRSRARHFSGSNVVISCGSSKIPLFSGSSNIDSGIKRSVVERINSYIRNESVASLHEKIRLRNAFGWVGLPFLVLGLWGLLGWPFSMVKYWRRRADTSEYVKNGIQR